MFNVEKGFSLVEVLIALVILTVAVFPIINYFTNSISIVHQSETMSQAADIAVDVMEILKNGDIETGTLNIDMSGSAPLDLDSLESAIYTHISEYDQFADYEAKIEISTISDYANIRLISLTISWDDNDYLLESIVRIR
jgi:type IV pilus modification protein PilV